MLRLRQELDLNHRTAGSIEGELAHPFDYTLVDYTPDFLTSREVLIISD